MDIAVAAYELTKNMPPAEMYGMVSQMRRASASIPANIAEGYGRESKGAYLNFLRVAQGSLKELETHFILSERVGLLGTDQTNTILQSCDELGRMLRGLIRSIDKERD
jgi:four helix bundle protein